MSDYVGRHRKLDTNGQCEATTVLPPVDWHRCPWCGAPCGAGPPPEPIQSDTPGTRSTPDNPTR